MGTITLGHGQMPKEVRIGDVKPCRQEKLQREGRKERKKKDITVHVTSHICAWKGGWGPKKGITGLPCFKETVR